MFKKIDIKIIACISILVVLILAIVLFLLLNKKEESIIGSWKYEKSDYIYTFNKDGTGKYYAIGTVMTFTYKVNENVITIHYAGEEKPRKIKFKIKGKKLIADDSLGEGTIYIKHKTYKDTN